MKRWGMVLGLAGLLILGVVLLRNRVAPTGEPPFPPALADVQRALQAAGYDPGPIDGRPGRRTRRAIKDFQSAHQLASTGEIDRATWRVLHEASRTKRRDKDDLRAAVMEHRLRSPERVRTIQRALKEAGFNPGPVDGELGPQTDDALRAFQEAHDLEPDGVVTMETWAALNRFLASAEVE